MALAVARILMATGLLGVLFVGFELSLTGLAEQRAQASLLTSFQHGITTTTLDGATSSPAEGSPVALLTIPRIGVDQVVVEGTTPADLKSGPGHLSGSPFPGEFGNSVIAAHRTSYGAPFGQLGLLAKGAAINVTTGQGYFTYVVRSVTRVAAGQPDSVMGSSDSRLTLVTSDPAYLANGRLAVVAGLKGRPIDVANRSPVLVGRGDLGLAGDSLGLGLGLIWGEVLVAAIWFFWRVRRRWPPAVLYLLGAPVVLILIVLTFSSFDLLLPGTL